MLTLIALPDSGALSNTDFVDSEVASWIVSKQIANIQPLHSRVCLAIKNVCYDSLGVITFPMTFYNELNNVFETISITANILKHLNYDLILSKRTLRKHSLFIKLPSIFLDYDSEDEQQNSDNVASTMCTLCTGTTNSTKKSTVVCSCRSVSPEPSTPTHRYEECEPPIAAHLEEQPKRNIKHRNELLDSLPVGSDLDLFEDIDNFIDTCSEPLATTLNINPDLLEEERAAILTLCLAYADCFGTDVKSEPARVAPFKPVLNKEQWEKPSNRQPPRVQSQEKQAAIIERINAFRELNVIRPSQAAHWSQILLVKKPDNSGFRFCIDFRALNTCMQSMGFPIPNIREMFLRLGSKRVKFMAACDLTSGYYQCPIDT